MNELVEELGQAMLPHELFSFNIFGYPIAIYDTVLSMWIIMGVIIAIAYVISKKMEMIPSRLQSVAEITVGGINALTKDAIGHHWKSFSPYIGTLMLFLAFSNIISIFNVVPNWHQVAEFMGMDVFKSFPEYSLRPPTKDINVTACLAIMSIFLVIGSSIKFRKPSGFMKSFFEPMPYLFPFKVLEYFIKPMSLCLRLFGNILAAFTIMELIYFASRSFLGFLFPAIIPSFFSLYFDLFDGLLQAYIFSFLTALYIGEAIEE